MKTLCENFLETKRIKWKIYSNHFSLYRLVLVNLWLIDIVLQVWSSNLSNLTHIPNILSQLYVLFKRLPKEKVGGKLESRNTFHPFKENFRFKVVCTFPFLCYIFLFIFIRNGRNKFWLKIWWKFNGFKTVAWLLIIYRVNNAWLHKRYWQLFSNLICWIFMS